MNQSIPILTTERLLLKAVTIQDAAAYKKHFVDYEVISIYQRMYLSLIPKMELNGF
jgi:hypothetical protein